MACSVQPEWRRLFGTGPHRFQMGLHPGRVEEFFAPTRSGARLLEERRAWLAEDRPRHCQLHPDGEPLLREFLEHAWLPPLTTDPSRRAVDRLADLGKCLEPDFLFLNRAGSGPFHLVGGVVCFPSSWSLEEKMGRPIGEIHGVVPGLNSSLGTQIDRFLERLAPGAAWERENWGLSPDPELNRHPGRRLASLGAAADLDRTWLRIEHQLLSRLGPTEGVLFGIRLSIHRLDQVSTDPAAREGLRRALETMAPEVAAYKGLSACRARLIEALRG